MTEPVEVLGSGGENTPEARREEYEKVRVQLANLKGLIEHPGWALLVGALTEQADNRRNRILSLASSIKDILGAEHMKAELLGIQLTLSLPEALIEQHEAAIEALKTEGIS